MAHKRNEVRGPGSNQHGDKPPLPQKTNSKKDKGKAKKVSAALLPLAETPHPKTINIANYVNPVSGFLPEEWTSEFADTVAGFSNDKSGMGGKLHGLMQYVPDGARYPDKVTPVLAERIRTKGFLNFEPPDPEDDDTTLVDIAFRRAVTTRRYAQSVNEEAELLDSMVRTQSLGESLSELLMLLDSPKPNRRKVKEAMEEAGDTVEVLHERSAGDKHSRSHLRSNMRIVKRELRVADFDVRKLAESFLMSEKYRKRIFKSLNLSHAESCMGWISDVYEGSFFMFRIAHFEQVSYNFEEIADMAERGAECASFLPLRDSPKAKKGFKKIQRQAMDMKEIMQGEKKGDLNAVSSLSPKFQSFKEVLHP